MNKITKKCLGINLRHIFSCTFSQSQDENTIEKQLFSYCVANVNTLRNKLLLQQKIGYLHEKCKEIEENNRMGKTRDFFKKIRETKGAFHASSVQFSRSVVSDSLRPHESQHARPHCPSPTPSSLRLASIESVMPSSHLILGRPLLLLPPIPPSIKHNHTELQFLHL